MDSSKEKMKRQISLSRAISDAIIAARVNGPIVSHPETYKKEEKIEEENPMKTIPVPDQVNEELPIKKEEPPEAKKEKRPPTPPPAPPASSLPAYEPILY